jgi:UV DNA damage endonuclease
MGFFTKRSKGVEIMIGYCCINTSIDRCVNRTMRKATFQEKGLKYAGELAFKNLDDMIHILKWNLDNDILMYRMSSDMFPWMSEYNFTDLPNFKQINQKCIAIGNFAKKHKMRLSFHPGPFNVLGSNNPNVVTKTINELSKHADIMDLMGLDQSHYYPINIHVNATKPDKQTITDNFCRNFKLLPENAQRRLTVENDDKSSQYSPKDLYNMIYKEIGIPITFDQFHYVCATDEPDKLQEALELSLSTWNGVRPLTHHSSSKRIEEDDPKIRVTAHAKYIYEPIQSFGHEFDTDLEAKEKDKAVLAYRERFKENSE